MNKIERQREEVIGIIAQSENKTMHRMQALQVIVEGVSARQDKYHPIVDEHDSKICKLEALELACENQIN